MRPEGSCSDVDMLAAFSQGRLDPDMMAQIERHVAACPRCEEVLAGLEEGDPVVGYLHRSLRRPPSPERILARIEARAASITPGRLRVTTGGAVPGIRSDGVPGHLGSYQLLRELGRGGMGTVYEAMHTRLKKRVAVKVLPAEHVHDPALVARFYREMEALGGLEHLNIVGATDAGEADGCHFLVMEFVDGLNLSTLIRLCGRLSVVDAAEVIRQAAIGLQFIHENGRVHRDIKPANMILSVAGEVKILDLGLALLRAHGLPENELTYTGQVMGTADYMAPEQWLNSHHVDIRADIYSLGCSLYKLLTGGAPFSGVAYETSEQKRAAHLGTVPPALDDVRPDVPAPLGEVFQRMLRKAPEARFSTPAEVVKALEPYCPGADLAKLLHAARLQAPDDMGADPPGASTNDGHKKLTVSELPRTQEAAPRTQRRWKLVAALAGALLGVGGLSVLVLSWPKDPQKESPGSVQPKGEAKGPPGALRPREWHNALDRPPIEFWWDPAAQGFHHFKPGSEQLIVLSPEVGLLQLGEATSASYKLDLGIRQNSWTGKVGLFFGGRRIAPDNSRLRYQLIQLTFPSPQDRTPALERSQGDITIQAESPPQFRNFGFASQMLQQPPGNTEQRLEITVRRGKGIAEVRWNGERCSKLLLVPANIKYTDEDYRGAFGVFCKGSDVIVSTAKVMPLE
jgi:serine/threonine protein kinase